MIITKAYINKHKTKAGAWTQSQIQALGVKWPPTKGWQDRIIGNELSPENAVIFEKKQTAKETTRRIKPGINKRLAELEQRIAELERIIEYQN